MDPAPHARKPYTVYRSEDGAAAEAAPPPREPAPPASGGRPPRRGRRRRRGGLLLVSSRSWSSPRSPPWPSRPCVRSAAATSATASTAAPSRGRRSDRRLRRDPPRPSRRPSPTPTAPAEPAPATVTAGGDVIGGFGVSGVVDSMGSDLFKSVAPYFEKSDFGFVNLESPLTNGGDPQGWKDVVIKGNPALAPAMGKSGINVVTMANNHAGDMGDSGLLDSIQLLREGTASPWWAPARTSRRAMAGTVLETENGAKTAFLGFTDVLPVGYPATSASPGVAPGPRRPRRRQDGHHGGGEEGRLRRRRLALELRVQARARPGSSRARARPPSTPAPTSSSPTIRICSTACRRTTAGSSSTASATWCSAASAGETAQTVLVRARLTKDAHRRAAHPRDRSAAPACRPSPARSQGEASCSA